jgi:hypothetical protein
MQWMSPLNRCWPGTYHRANFKQGSYDLETCDLAILDVMRSNKTNRPGGTP